LEKNAELNRRTGEEGRKDRERAEKEVGLKTREKENERGIAAETKTWEVGNEVQGKDSTKTVTTLEEKRGKNLRSDPEKGKGRSWKGNSRVSRFKKKKTTSPGRKDRSGNNPYVNDESHQRLKAENAPGNRTARKSAIGSGGEKNACK